MNLFTAVEMAPRDPILGLNEQFAADPNPNKVNLGVGVYTDDNGKVPVLECVQRVVKKMAETAQARAYLPIDGMPAYNKAVQELVFGADGEVELAIAIDVVRGDADVVLLRFAVEDDVLLPRRVLIPDQLRGVDGDDVRFAVFIDVGGDDRVDDTEVFLKLLRPEFQLGSEGQC